MKKYILILLSLLGGFRATRAGSFQLPTQGVRQTAMGGSGAALPWDVSTLFFNPAGLSRLSGWQVQANGYMLRPNVRYAAPDPGSYYSDNVPKSSFPFALYFGGKLRETDAFAYGVGIYTPFGSSLQWPDDWRGRYINQRIALSTIFFQPTVSYAINQYIAVGAGFIYGTGNMEITKGIPVQDADGEGQALLSGRASGIGFSAGIQIQVNEKYAIGLSYRNGPEMTVQNGKATFSVPRSLSGMFPNTTFRTAVSLPDNWTLGLSGKVTDQLTVQADLIYATWSKYTSLNIDFEDNTDLLKDASEPRHFTNTLAIRAGASYAINHRWSAMAGASYDPTPTSDDYVSPDAADGNRTGVSAGLSYDINTQLNITAAVGYVSVSAREGQYKPAHFEGTYQLKSFSPALSISYRF